MESVIYPKIGRLPSVDKESNLFFFVTALTLLIIFIFVGYVPVKGSSMMPTIQERGEGVIVVRYLKSPEIGDIVIVNNNDKALTGVVHKQLIKRVVAKGGDTISLLPSTIEGEEHKVVLKVNGIVVDEPYTYEMTIYNMDRYQEKIVVPTGYVFVLGDNRAESADSRTFGIIEESRIDSVAVFIIGSAGIRNA